MTSNASTKDNPGRSLRRSTRLNQIIAITVVGVDSYRGPYREEVSTVTINCHGCRYQSKYEVFSNAWVILEIPATKKPGDTPQIARGIVKWVQRSVNEDGLQLTAIELDYPGNIWGIDVPPSDWLQYCGPKDPAASSAKPKPFAVRKPELRATVAIENKTSSSLPVASTNRSLGQLMGDFQRQMEQTLSDSANTVVRERSAALFEELRASMRDEAKLVLAEAASRQAGTWMADFVKQLKQAEQNFSARAIQRIESGLETSRNDPMSCIGGPHKEQVVSVMGGGKKTAGDPRGNREELERMSDQALEKSSVRMEELCARLEKQFKMIIQSHLDGSREDLQQARRDAMNLAHSNLQAISQHSESGARERFLTSLQPVAANILIALTERATEKSREFSDELADYGRSYLEYLGNSVTDLARGFGKRSKE